MKRWLMLSGLVVIVAVGLIIALTRKTRPAHPVENTRSNAPATAVHAQGRVESVTEVEVRSKAAGTLSRLLVAEGQKVRAGDTIAVLDDAQQRAQLQHAEKALLAARERLREAEALAAHRQSRSDKAIQEAQARISQYEAGKVRCEAAARDAASELQLAQKEEARIRSLSGSGAVAARDLDAATARVTSAQARLASAQAEIGAAEAELRSARAVLESAQVGPEPTEVESARRNVEEVAADVQYEQTVLRDMVVRAPFSGTVTRKIAEQGQVLLAGEAVCLLAATERMRVNAEVDETDVARIRVGDTAKITHEAFPGRVFEAKVTRIGSLAGQHTVRSEDPTRINDFRVVDVKIEGGFPEALRLGMTVDVEIECQ